MVKNGMKLVNKGDKQAQELYIKWRQIKHPNNEKLSNQQVEAIVDYLKKL